MNMRVPHESVCTCGLALRCKHSLKNVFTSEPFLGRCEVPSKHAEHCDASEDNAGLEIRASQKQKRRGDEMVTHEIEGRRGNREEEWRQHDL